MKRGQSLDVRRGGAESAKSFLEQGGHQNGADRRGGVEFGGSGPDLLASLSSSDHLRDQWQHLRGNVIVPDAGKLGEAVALAQHQADDFADVDSEDPDHAVFGILTVGKLMERFDVLSEIGGKAIDNITM